MCLVQHRRLAEEFEMTRPLVRSEDEIDCNRAEEPMRFRLGPITWFSGANVAREPSAPVMTQS